MPDKKPAYVKLIVGIGLIIAGLVLIFTGRIEVGLALVTAGLGVLRGKRLLVKDGKKVIDAVKRKPKK